MYLYIILKNYYQSQYYTKINYLLFDITKHIQILIFIVKFIIHFYQKHLCKL